MISGVKKDVQLICPIHKKKLEYNEKENRFICQNKCSFSIINNIPRFVPYKNYADSFGLQWNTYKQTQLDSFTKTTISQDRLKRLLGGTFEILQGKDVLEAGCGAGRFTEILLQNGANVFSVDLSAAVEANYDNCKMYQNYFVCQADITNLPVSSDTFDLVICIGVIQHTPDPEKTIDALSSYVKPGGLLVIDHYTYGYPETPSRKILHAILTRMPPQFSMSFVKYLTNILWPIHKYMRSQKQNNWIKKGRTIFLNISPLVDYHDAYPQLQDEQLKTWAMLDTHDTLTDHYKHLRTSSEIQNQLLKCGMENIQIALAGNGIEAKANKPLK
ncbi:MAG: hypothetical protein CVV30_02935 [Methanomicrobiales archaeon HGW-Methanomicrobiales-1]|jgi:2-polyprenyl-3-methyl-5-hydroxy-6-metoxy-1,4-benzoquinol methylase|nr:MAG: hypothetical protein CVV30_02935 [Methanomicrobiales archaeon HGW-Methanomicrobiales-1]